MRRVLVLGCSGSGKSTLSRRLAAMTGLPLIELDLMHWRHGWTAPSAAEWRKIVEVAAAEPEWIMDGNYAGTFDLRMPRADTVVWLDYPRRTCLWRVAKRIACGYGHTREGLPAGCPEHLDWSFIRYICTFNEVQRPTISAAFERYGADIRLVHLADDRGVNDFCATIAEAKCQNLPTHVA